MLADGMWIILLEMLVALALGLFIVWWTWPRGRKPAERDPAAPEDKDTDRR
ncbi:MAG: hypothetical protein JNM90_19020 [Burkholderiales bacterium]|nr:hypothetical protein [Burkholderiales bacterium]